MMEAAEPGRRPGQQFVGVDLRRPKGYVPAAASQGQALAPAAEGDPCPRCESRDTKFCYYNNYNTAQPRHFCKGCRRYWTKGGTLRNVPVGGGTRKKPASSSSSPPPSSSMAEKLKPQKPSKKKRRLTAPEAPAPAPDATDSAKTTTETAATDTASEVTDELAAPAAAAVAAASEEEESLVHLLQPYDASTVTAIELGVSDLPAGKASLLELTDSFEWPPSFDLGGACWGGAAFADPDPAMFLNFP